MAKTKEIPLLVTTAHKGVFFGYGQPSDAATITIKRARMCIYYSSDMKGVLGLATLGPSKSCKVGPAVDELILREVTAVVKCTANAAGKWESQPWNS